MSQLADYLQKTFDGYREDPAETDFQQGYLAALVELARVLEPQVKTADLQRPPMTRLS
jgi:hypothetical protein